MIGPRLLLAPVIYLRQKTGIMESVRLSYAKSRGYWWKIVGNALLAGLCIVVLLMVAWIIFGIVFSFYLPLSTFAFYVLPQLAIAFGTVFYVKLATEVLKYPLVVGTPAKTSKPKKLAAKKK